MVKFLHMYNVLANSHTYHVATLYVRPTISKPSHSVMYLYLLLLCSYLEKVLDYLSDYLDRVHPLLDQNALYEEIEKEFEDKWLQGNFPGWRVGS